ncbi:hypothetical protein [Carnobacterium maltaromaticum]|uniref:hypothetical protein n=1 Tax=Carnobacterium maltaromaticum TaxID=2751 RepID=UPI00026C8A52|nr:hypothetical protein [Carnobacterium maltaromaticum]
MSETKNVVYAVTGYDSIEWDPCVQKVFMNKIDALKFIRSNGFKKLREGMYYDSSDEFESYAYCVEEWEVN